MSLRVRKKKNASGSISIHIIDRTNRGYKLVESLGSSKDEKEIEKLYQKALERIDELENNLLFVSKRNNKKELLKDLLSEVTTQDFIPIGDEIVFGRLFDEIGCKGVISNNSNQSFRKIEDKEFLFRSLVLSRIIYPGSKLELINYLDYFKKKSINEDKIYRFLDFLYQEEIKSKIEECVFNHTLKIMNNTIKFTFYDVTTLHFESESEDDLRRVGFSKEGKLNRPQILLGLFTTLEGYPLSFEVYEGNKYEGHTLIDILQKFQERFNIKDKPCSEAESLSEVWKIVVADRGMLSNDNIAYLENNGYKYILAYRVKNTTNDLKSKIANLVFIGDGDIKSLNITKEILYNKETNSNTDNKRKKEKLLINQRLIVTYSEKRAKKDRYTIEKALEKIENELSNKNITKGKLKLSYYAKYLDIDKTCKIKYKLSEDKVILDEKLDGIKAFATNDFSLKPKDVIAHYKNQYKVEEAFRISKTDLRVRPIYHRLENRIKANAISLSFKI